MAGISVHVEDPCCPCCIDQEKLRKALALLREAAPLLRNYTLCCCIGDEKCTKHKVSEYLWEIGRTLVLFLALTVVASAQILPAHIGMTAGEAMAELTSQDIPYEIVAVDTGMDVVMHGVFGWETVTYRFRRLVNMNNQAQTYLALIEIDCFYGHSTKGIGQSFWQWVKGPAKTLRLAEVLTRNSGTPFPGMPYVNTHLSRETTGEGFDVNDPTPTEHFGVAMTVRDDTHYYFLNNQSDENYRWHGFSLPAHSTQFVIVNDIFP